MDKDGVFSDIEEELIYLPVSPIPDVPNQQDQLLESSVNIVDSGSPLSEPTGHVVDTSTICSNFYIFFVFHKKLNETLIS